MRSGLILLVFIYSFLFLNLSKSHTSAQSGPEVQCPDGMAYGLPNGKYIKCENFDEYHKDQWRGVIRTDLYLN